MNIRQNAHLTFKENVAAGRHGWLRLTPAYSFKLVADTLADLTPGTTVLDPFSGSGTTGLYAAQAGLDATLVDLNPFLIWLAKVKTRNYTMIELDEATRKLKDVVELGAKLISQCDDLWEPPIHNIERWWTPGILKQLKGLRAALDEHYDQSPSTDLLLVGLCRTVIDTSAAAFNHQSMSFKGASSELTLFDADSVNVDVLQQYRSQVRYVIDTAVPQMPGTAKVLLGDARSLKGVETESIQSIYTSPPYANRISYIRELRPYMYWLRFLNDAREAAELDWQAIGGTWGVATSRVGQWTRKKDLPPMGSFSSILEKITAEENRSGPLLARYVEKYFHDMWDHFRSAYRVLCPGGKVTYVIGNSTFFKHIVPSQEWYAELLHQAGFCNVTVRTLRKRNSKAELFEFAVTAYRN
jgi:hypothetical protein